MNRKKMLKRLFGVACFLVVLCLVVQYGYAKETTSSCPNKPSDRDLEQLFNVTFNLVGDNTYELVRNCSYDSKNKDLKDSVMYVTVPDYESIIDNKELSCAEGGNKKATIVVNAGTANDAVATVSVNNQFVYSEDCTLSKAEVKYASDYNVPSGGTVSIDKSLITDGLYVEGGRFIICDSSNEDDWTYISGWTKEGEWKKPVYSKVKKPSFEYSYCKSKRRAIDVDHKVYDANKKTKIEDKDNLTFKCDYSVDSIKTDPSELEEDKYFTNIHSTYASKVTTETDYYTYHLYPSYNASKNKVEVSCKITCEEAVDVEYGPPVASRAGMCFEYKVRVTSRVTCGMDEDGKPDLPELNAAFFTPAPTCRTSSGTPYDQGGPNEDFDACIKDCDGGKYSMACSKSCYQSVYGNVSANAKVKSNYFDNILATDVTRDPRYLKGKISGASLFTDHGENECGKSNHGTSNCTCAGYYDFDGDNVTWNNMGGVYNPGRWYCEKRDDWKAKVTSRGFQVGNYGVVRSDGFFRHDYGTYWCDDDCTWDEDGQYEKYLKNYKSGKTDTIMYLNPSYTIDGKTYSIQDDLEKNAKVYNSLVQRCMAKATCSTTVSTYTISANYKNGEGDNTVKFPTEYSNDSLQHEGSSTVDQKETTLLLNYPKDNDGIWGCYRKDGLSVEGDNGLSEGEDRYRATWSFPGSWMNLKTGEVSYTPKDKTCDGSESSCVWYEHDHRFCIPLDAKNVNVTWWALYTQRKIGAQGLSLSTSSTKINEVCDFNSEHSFVNVKESDLKEKDITWNINAETTKFGYFGWTFDISCFYAINDNPLCSHSCCEKDSPCTTDEPDECKPEAGEYRVRTTDPEDLFPSEDGTIITTPTEAGRIPGYNWSEYAINNKNEHYQSNPVEYMKQIQRAASDAKSKGTEIYTDDNLDYMFILSPKTLRQMRKDRAGTLNSQNNYAAFDDNRFTLNSKTFGIARYKSQKIRDLTEIKKIPEEPLLYCNNIDWSRKACDDVHDDVHNK